MFPRISDVINYLFGTHLNIPIQSYGFMVAMAFLSGAVVLYFELKRKEREGLIPVQQKMMQKGAPATLQELFFSGLFGFLAGWKGAGIALDYSTFSLDPQAYILSRSGSWVAGIILGLLFAGYHYYRKRKERLEPPVMEEVTIHPYQLTGSILLVAAIFGIIGAKIFDTVEHLDDLMRDPAGTLLSLSGLSFYGGLLIAAFAVVWYTSRNRIRLPFIADAIAPALILAYAVGRMGCQLSGDGCWGVANPNPMPEWLSFLPGWVWSFTYPHNVIDTGILMPGCGGEHCYVLPYPVWPTPLYETLIGLVIFGILMSVRNAFKTPGFVFSIYLILNGIERLAIEEVRINKPYDFLGIQVTQAQVIAIILIILGILSFWFWRWMERKYREGETRNNKQ